MKPWRAHPRLIDRLHPDHPDDLQVIVHDGGPRVSQNSLEAIWARIVDQQQEVFSAIALNQPHAVKAVSQGGVFRFIVPDGAPHPILASDAYIRERPLWVVHPCDKCGLSELFDPPSVLIKTCFPNLPADAILESFTAFCPLCGGAQVVQSVGAANQGQASSKTKPWWRFW